MTNHDYEEKLKSYIKEQGIEAEHLSFDQSCHSVQEAAQAAQTNEDNFVKNICMKNQQGNIIVAIVKGEDRASTSRVAKALQIERPELCSPDEILTKTGYPCGGTPSFGYEAKFLIDPRVIEKEIIYSGGGSENSLVKISPITLQRTNNAQIVRVRS